MARMQALSRSVRSPVASGPVKAPPLLIECARFVRQSRSLASMMPALLFSGAISLVVSMLLHGLTIDVVELALHGWLESWLTLWPLLFPPVYLGSLAARKVRGLTAARMARPQGLGYADIATVSKHAGHGLAVLRGLRSRHHYQA